MPAVPTVSKELLERGESLVTHGDAANNIPACSSCHGPHLTGMDPAIPGLLGLRADYISAQLGAWRYGTRTAAEPDCMQIVAGHLTEEGVKAIAAFLAARPAPPICRRRPRALSLCRLLAGVSRNDSLHGEARLFDRNARRRVDPCQLRGAERGREAGGAG